MENILQYLLILSRSRSGRRADARAGPKTCEEMTREPLCKNVSILIFGGDVKNTNSTNLHLFTDKVNVQLNMFGSLGLNRIRWCCTTITNIPNPKLMSRNTNPNYCCDDNCNSHGSERVEESAMKVVRSVVAGVLLKRYDEVSVFTPLDTRGVLGYLRDDYLLSELEKDALLEVGANFYDGDDNKMEENQTIKLALNHALLSIQADTGAVSCYPAVMADNKEKTVFVMSIQPDKLVAELSPFPLRFDYLRMSVHDLFPDLQQRHEDRQKELREMMREFPV